MRAGRRLVLVVDDEPIVLTYLSNALRSRGYDFLLAEDGERGLAMFFMNRDEIDLIVTDVAMPRMGGAEMIREVWPLAPDLKVIYMTGYSPSQVVPDDMRACRVLSKPFSPLQLFRALDAELNAGARPATV